jgi:hypothetical protein
MKTSNRQNICFAASTDGHLAQLLRLSPLWYERQHFFGTNSEKVLKELRNHSQAYPLGGAGRRHPAHMLLMVVRCVDIYLRERPNLVMGASASVGCIMEFLVNLAGGKII